MSEATKFTVNPQAPMRSPKAMLELIDAYRGNIEELLPENIDWDKFKANLRNAIIELPALLGCTQISFVQAVITACELGLHIGKARGEGYIIPFRTKQKDGPPKLEATFIPGYRGLVKAAYGTGAVRRIDTANVHERDEFEYERGLNPRLYHKPYVPKDAKDSPGGIIGTYCVIELMNGSIIFDYLPIAELLRIRRSSQAPDSPAYRNWTGEMYRKGAFRRTVKWAVLDGVQFNQTLAQANLEFDLDESEVDAQARGTLNRKLRGRLSEDPPVEDADFEPVMDDEGDEGDEGDVDAEDDDMDTEEGQSDSIDDDDLLALRRGFVLYLDGDDDAQAEFLRMVTGGKASTIEEMTRAQVTKAAKIINRIHVRLNATGKTQAMCTMFISWAIVSDVKLRTVKSVDDAIPVFREQLEQADDDSLDEQTDSDPSSARGSADDSQGALF